MGYFNKPLLGTPINWSHPLAKGLVGCWLMNEGSGDRVNDYSGNQNTGVLQNSASRVPGGIDLENTTGDCIICGNSPIFNLQSHTIFCKIKAESGYPNPLVNKERITQGGFIWYLGTEAAYTGDIAFAYFDTGIRGWYRFDTNLSVGVDYTLGLVCQKTEGLAQCFVNGVQFGAGVSTTTANILYPVVYDFKIGGRNLLVNSETFDGIFYFLYIYNRALTPSEITQLHADPYCMFMREEDYIAMMIDWAAGGVPIPVFMHHYLRH